MAIFAGLFLLPVISAVVYRDDDSNNLIIYSALLAGLFLSLAAYVNNVSIDLFDVIDNVKFGFFVDSLGIFFAVTIFILWSITFMYSREYFGKDNDNKRFYIFFFVSLISTMGILFSRNLIVLYTFYEALTLGTYPLVIYLQKEKSYTSGRKYLIYSFLGASLILIGILILLVNGVDINFYPERLMENIGSIKMLDLAYLMMFLGFGVKAAVVPFHGWLPKAMVAPTPVSALLHAVAVVKMAVFSIMRVTFFVFGFELVRKFHSTTYVTYLVLLTILLGSLIAIHHNHLKMRLAYSTISQLGYILLGILMLSPDGFKGSLLHFVNHGVIKINLFFIAGIIHHEVGSYQIDKLKGLGKKMPDIFICFLISAISLVGIPPTNGFVSKWFLGIGALGIGKVSYVLVLLLSAFLTASYILPIPITALFFENKHEEEISLKGRFRFSVYILTGAIIVLGIYPNPFIGFVDKIVALVF